jgi:hypothetical protein
LAVLELFLDLLGFGGVGPESGLGGGPFEEGYFFFLAGQVKDTPIGGRRGPSDWRFLPCGLAP